MNKNTLVQGGAYTSRRHFVAALTGAFSGMSWSQSGFPNRPMRIVVPFAPGGAADSSARLVAEHYTRRLGQQVIIENRPGASGNIGAKFVASAEPDGYTLLLGFDGTMVINPHVYPNIPFDTVNDFAPIGKIGDIGLLIVANPKLGAKDLRDVIALSRARADGLSVGSAGLGSTAHLMAELIKQRTGANLVHIPYKGAGPALIAVLSGETQLAIIGLAGTPQHVRAGTLQAIAISSAQRSKLLPEVPTIAEAGNPDLVLNSWNGILAPARTPRAIIERLNLELNNALADTVAREKLDSLGFTATLGTPENYADQIKRDLTRYGQVVKAANIKME